MVRHQSQQNRKGIALVVALIAMVVVGALVTGIFSSTMIEQQTAENTRRQSQAFSVAEAAMGEIVADWDAGTYNFMANNASLSVSGASPGGTGSYSATITRVNSEFFLVDVVGKDRSSRSRQRVASLVKLRLLQFDVRAALTTRGDSRIGGSVNISGHDAPPWSDCPPAGASESGIRHPDVSQIDFIGSCNDQSCVTGSPNVENDPSVNDNTFFNYGPSDWAALSAMATVIVSGGTMSGIQPAASGGRCTTSSTNWGEPLEPGTVPLCRNYFPVIYSSGDIHLTTGRGQGVLMVNGNLTLSGNFQFDGVVVVRGELRTTGTGNHITGGVLAANVDLDESAVLGNAVLTYSQCAIQRVTSASSPSAQLRSRGWMQTF